MIAGVPTRKQVSRNGPLRAAVRRGSPPGADEAGDMKGETMTRTTKCTDCGIEIGLDAPGIFQCRECWTDYAVRTIMAATA